MAAMLSSINDNIPVLNYRYHLYKANDFHTVKKKPYTVTRNISL